MSREDREPGQEHGAARSIEGSLCFAPRSVCTIGLASREPETLEALIRAAADKVGKPVGILADLQGPKLRVGEMIDSASRIHAMTSS